MKERVGSLEMTHVVVLDACMLLMLVLGILNPFSPDVIFLYNNMIFIY